MLESIYAQLHEGDSAKVPVSRELPALRARLAMEERTQRENEANAITALGAYQRFRIRNPAWDAAALDALELFYGRIHFDPDRRYEVEAEMLAKFERASALGCNDPFVKYTALRAQNLHGGVSNSLLAARLKSAANEMSASKYPESRKCFASLVYGETVGFATNRQLNDDLNEAARQIQAAETALLHVIPGNEIAVKVKCELAERITSVAWQLLQWVPPEQRPKVDRKAEFDIVFPPLETACETAGRTWRTPRSGAT